MDDRLAGSDEGARNFCRVINEQHKYLLVARIVEAVIDPLGNEDDFVAPDRMTLVQKLGIRLTAQDDDLFIAIVAMQGNAAPHRQSCRARSDGGAAPFSITKQLGRNAIAAIEHSDIVAGENLRLRFRQCHAFIFTVASN